MVLIPCTSKQVGMIDYQLNYHRWLHPEITLKEIIGDKGQHMERSEAEAWLTKNLDIDQASIIISALIKEEITAAKGQLTHLGFPYFKE